MTDQTAQRQVTIGVQEGLHLRPADALVSLAKSFDSSIRIETNDVTADGKSILELIALAAGHGSQLTITANGADADAAVNALAELIERDFDLASDESGDART